MIQIITLILRSHTSISYDVQGLSCKIFVWWQLEHDLQKFEYLPSRCQLSSIDNRQWATKSGCTSSEEEIFKVFISYGTEDNFVRLWDISYQLFEFFWNEDMVVISVYVLLNVHFLILSVLKNRRGSIKIEKNYNSITQLNN